MNSLLAILQPPEYLAGVHARLGQQLGSTQHAQTHREHREYLRSLQPA